MIGGTITAITHIAVTTLANFHKSKFLATYPDDSSCVVKQMIANSLLYLAINFAGMYTKYLTDRGQRLAFIETHKAMEHKKESEKEYQKTQRLLDSSELKKYNIIISLSNFLFSFLVFFCFNMTDVKGIIPSITIFFLFNNQLL